VRHRLAPGLLIAVALGGAAGTLLRAEVAETLPPSSTGFPWGILLVNLVGCAVVGFVMVAALERVAPSRYFRPLVGTGFCGGLTTFSTFVVQVDLLVRAGHVPTALWYVMASLLGGLAATRAAVVLARAAWTGKAG
jgi:fluoride exporter